MNLFSSAESTHCPLWFALIPPAPLRLDAMVQTWSRLRQVSPERSSPVPSGSVLATPSLVFGPNVSPEGSPLEIPTRRDL